MLITYLNTSLNINLSATKVRELIGNEITTTNYSKKEVEYKYFKGEETSKGFKVRRLVFGRNSFVPVVKINIEEGNCWLLSGDDI